MFFLSPYDRALSVQYAHTWAYRRNPHFYDYERIGGDCTNFASQCLYAGSGIMNFTPTFGWYYRSANDKAPAWTGVIYLHQFLVREKPSAGPFAVETSLERMQPGDIVQLSFDGIGWHHSPVVVTADRPKNYDEILVAAHSYDADDRPLASYEFRKVRFLHIGGVYHALT